MNWLMVRRQLEDVAAAIDRAEDCVTVSRDEPGTVHAQDILLNIDQAVGSADVLAARLVALRDDWKREQFRRECEIRRSGNGQITE